MKRPGILVLLAAVSVTACAQESPPAPAAAESPPATPAAATVTPAEEPGETAEAGAQSEMDAAASSQESTGEAADPADRGDAGLERLAALPADQQLPNGRWKAGQHYVPLVPAQPTNVGPGEVEVVEVFWYGCSHCYALEPFLDKWDQKNAEFVKLVKVPVMWSPGHRGHARLFYALEALDRGDLHQKVFDTIHQRRQQLLGRSERETEQLHVQFAGANGIEEKPFLQAYNSFMVNSNLQRAERLTTAYRVQGVPLVVVNGKYTTDVGMAGGHQELLALLDDLAASERR